MSKPQSDSVPAQHPARYGDGSEATLTVFNGRPTKYHAGMVDKVQHYINACPDLVPSMEGLSLELGVSLRTLHGWKSSDAENMNPDKYPKFSEFLHMLDCLMAHQARTALNEGTSGGWSSVVAKLVLSKHGYADKQEHTLEAGLSLVDIYASMLAEEPEAGQVKQVDSEDITPKTLQASERGL